MYTCVTAPHEQEQARSTENAEPNEGVCNGTTKAKQKRSTENAEPHVGCTNKPGSVRGEWSVIVTTVLGIHAHEGKPTTPKAVFRLFSSISPKRDSY